MKIPELIAHRGYAAGYPENTLPAFTAAINAGALYVECDVQITADLVPVVFHDTTLTRLCNKPGMIHDYTLEGLREFSAAFPERFGDKFSDVKIPTLQELVDLLITHPEVSVFVELKRNSLELFADQMVDMVLDRLKNLKKQAILISYDIKSLYKTRERGWTDIGAVIDLWQDSQREDILELKPGYLFCDVNGLPAVGAISFPGAKVAIFEIAEPELAMQLAGRGVDMVETFDFEGLKPRLGVSKSI